MSGDMDLTVWYEAGGEICGFQLCYDKEDTEKALTWKADSGFLHMKVDTGRAGRSLAKMTPILVRDGTVDKDRLLRMFKEEAANLSDVLSRFVCQKINHISEKPGS